MIGNEFSFFAEMMMQYGNEIGDEGAKAIAAAFHVNTAVNELYLVSCRVQN